MIFLDISHWLTLFKPPFNCESTSEPSPGIVKTMLEGLLTALFTAVVLTPDDSWGDTWQRADTGHGQMWHNNWGNGLSQSKYLLNMKIIHKHKTIQNLNVHYFVSDYENIKCAFITQRYFAI